MVETNSFVIYINILQMYRGRCAETFPNRNAKMYQQKNAKVSFSIFSSIYFKILYLM